MFGGGQLDDIESKLLADECDLLIVDSALSPIQQRNLEKRLNLKVIDRTGLILEIFGLRARTKAGRLQVELARLNYERSRLVRTWTHLERQRGGKGAMSGPGETQIESDRRMIDRALQRLKSQLSEVERTRRLQRQGRKARETPVVALVGYTNTGKSTLFNQLSNASVFAQDMPFATLDPTIRNVKLASNRSIALVDTVGFISDLPTQLVEAFKSTLEETIDADVLLHVHDASSDDIFAQQSDVEVIIDELTELLDIEVPPVIHVLNKADKLSAVEIDVLMDRFQSDLGDAQTMSFSALTGEGRDELITAISNVCFQFPKTLHFRTPHTDGEFTAFVYEIGDVSIVDGSENGESKQIEVQLSEIAYARLLKRFSDKVQSYLVEQ